MEVDNTRLTKEEIIERLIKYYWDKGIGWVMPRNSTYQQLLNDLQSLIKEGISEYVPIDDGPLSLIIYKLPINTIFRLYQYSSQIRKLVDTRYGLFWRKFIERDLGVVPLFTVNFKLYYLRMMNMPIAGSYFVSDQKHTGTVNKMHNSVVSMYKNWIVTAPGKVYNGLNSYDILNVGEIVLNIGKRRGSLILFTNHGIKIYGGFVNISQFDKLNITRMGMSSYDYLSVVTTHEGDVYLLEKNLIKLQAPEKIISAEFLDPNNVVLLSLTGKLYLVHLHSNPTYKTELIASNIQYITDQGSNWLSFDSSLYGSLLLYVEEGPNHPLTENKIVVSIYNDRYIDKDLRIQKITEDPRTAGSTGDRMENESIDIGFIDILQYEGKYGVRLLPQIKL